jgi:hypothetical protein
MMIKEWITRTSRWKLVSGQIMRHMYRAYLQIWMKYYFTAIQWHTLWVIHVPDKFSVTGICTNECYAHTFIAKLLLNYQFVALTILKDWNIRMLFQGLLVWPSVTFWHTGGKWHWVGCCTVARGKWWLIGVNGGGWNSLGGSFMSDIKTCGERNDY